MSPQEVLVSLTGARLHRSVLGPTNEDQLPPAMVAEEDIITERSGANEA